MAYTREPLSGSTHGTGVKVAATSSAGTTIHTAQASTTLTDVVTLYATNTNTTTERLVVQWGGTTAVDNDMIFDLPPKSFLCIVPDMILRNSLVIKAYSTTTNVVTIHGYVNTES